MYCPKCGKEVADQAKFCGYCGAEMPVRAAAPAAEAPREPETAPATSAPAAKPRTPYLVVAAIALVAVLGAGVAAALNGFGSKPQQPAADPSGTTEVVSANGATVTALARPRIISADSLRSMDITVSPVSFEQPSTTSELDNANLFYFEDEAERKLLDNGFYVSEGSAGEEFYPTYEDNRYNFVANFVTVDSMMHTYHLYFMHLQKNTEINYLADDVLSISEDMLATTLSQLETLRGTEWEEAAKTNAAFFAVGASLMGATPEIPQDVASVVQEELARIEDHTSMGEMVLLPETMEDYTQYIVRGYYEGNATLEAYFRTMMWYGRVNFAQSKEDQDRSAALMVLAMQGDSLERWERVYTVTSFFAGASDDCGYYEYRPILEAAYGANVSVEDLAGNASAWEDFHAMTAEMPAPQINSIPHADDSNTTDENLEGDKGFRFMGQRFSIDADIFENLIYDRVGQNSAGEERRLPDALDVCAALGSNEALSILEGRGATDFAGYSENLDKLREEYSSAPSDVWAGSLYSQWLYTLQPLLAEKSGDYPAFMQSSAWARKSLQSYLGSYTELKHDTVLYSKQVMAEAGGGEIPQYDDRGYVEPEPEVFGRLADLTNATSTGLDGFGILSATDKDNLALLSTLAEDLCTIATKELAGESLTDDEYELIRSYGVQLEHFWNETNDDNLSVRELPAAIVTDVATDSASGNCLQLGTGRVSKIFVIVNVEGVTKIASGSVFSFYEFENPASNRLTDSTWREMMGIGLSSSGAYPADNGPDIQDWTQDFTVQRFKYSA